MDIFVYGTLRDKGVREAVLGHPVAEAVPAIKPGHSARLVKGEAYPMIKPMDGHDAEGMILKGLSQEDIDMLDRFEGENYQRMATDVMTADGDMITTEMYVEIAGRDEDGPFDLDGWLHTKREAFISSFMQGRGFDRPKD